MIERSCPVCCERGSSRLFADADIDHKNLDAYAFASRKLPEYMHHRLLCCDHCDVIYASPVPSVDELEMAYESAAFDSQDLAVQAAATYAGLVEKEIGRLKDRRGAVDIGTGEGAFLRHLLRFGFQSVHGVEPSRAPVESASSDVKPLIRLAMFEHGLFPLESNSLVTCFQTIEHVSDPLSLCENAFEILAPGGMLCIVGHNRRAFSARMLGWRSPIFDIEHLQLFSPKSLKELLERSGFSDVRVSGFWNSYPLSYWVRLFPFPAKLKSVLTAVLGRSGLGRFRVAIPAGNLVAFGTKPLH
jgi:SAM-dependent methyltransferase